MSKKQVGEKGVLIGLYILIHHQMKSGQNFKQHRSLEAEADAEAMEGVMLTDLLLIACSF